MDYNSIIKRYNNIYTRLELQKQSTIKAMNPKAIPSSPYLYLRLQSKLDQVSRDTPTWWANNLTNIRNYKTTITITFREPAIPVSSYKTSYHSRELPFYYLVLTGVIKQGLSASRLVWCCYIRVRTSLNHSDSYRGPRPIGEPLISWWPKPVPKHS